MDLHGVSDAERAALLQLVLIEARIGVAARLEYWSNPLPGAHVDGRSVTANLEWVLGGLLDLAPGRVEVLLERVRRNQLVEVRCCCRPEKLLGWFELPKGELQAYQRVRLVKRPPANLSGVFFEAMYIDLELREWGQRHVDGWPGEEWRGGLAFYSDDTPIEELRQVACFLENRSSW